MDNIFDSHAHYDSESFGADKDGLLAQLPSKGVRYVMNAASNLDSARMCLAFAEKYEFIYASAGIHPHDSECAAKDWQNELTRLLAHPKVKAVGEIGLDYHYDFSPREMQLEIFEEQLKIAIKYDMPVIIHDREAHEDTLRLLKKYRPKGIIHCYSGSVEMVKELLNLGLYIGFTGVVTFKNARKSLEAAAQVPLDHLLIETDCPYMAPEPYRGKRCDSSMLDRTAEALARVKNIPTQELLDITCENAKTVYSIQ